MSFRHFVPRKKPIWLPTAKTKVFRIPQKPVLSEEEATKIKQLYDNYKTSMKSFMYLVRYDGRPEEKQFDVEVMKKEEEDDFIRSSQINDEWNQKIAAERELRLAKEREDRRLEILEKIQMKKIMKKQMAEEAEAKVIEVKRLAPTFITRENIDEAIEKALASTVDHNKALDPGGAWYTDKTGLPPKSVAETKVQIKQ